MCLAIAPNQQCSNGIIGRVLRIISSTPLRLFSFCALIHSLILGSLYIHNATTGAYINKYAFTSGLTYGILALLAFGYLLTWLPRKHSLPPIHYGRYSTIYLFMMVGLGFLEAGIFAGNKLIFAGMFLLIPGWLMTFQCLWNIHIWINSGAQQINRVLMLLLSLNLITLGLSVLGQYVSASKLATLATLSSTVLIWPLLIATTLILLLNAPDKGRVISP
jgi:hypothetical protein